MDYRVTYGSDTITVTTGQPEQPLLVDGRETGYQCADGSCRTEQLIRLACRYTWGPVVEHEEDAHANASVCVWDDVEYEPIETDEA